MSEEKLPEAVEVKRNDLFKEYYTVVQKLDKLQGEKEELRDLIEKFMSDSHTDSMNTDWGEFKLFNMKKKVLDEFAKSELKVAKEVVKKREAILIKDGNIQIQEVKSLRFKKAE